MRAQFEVAPLLAPVEGTTVYRKSEYSIDFIPKRRDVPPLSIGHRPKASLAIGMLQLEVDIESRQVLYPWGYFPSVSWKPGSVVPPPAIRNGLQVAGGTILREGVSETLWDRSLLETRFDRSSGWLELRLLGGAEGGTLVEFASNCIATLAHGALRSLYVKCQWQ